ncbi:family 16 glycosylhydrolase [Demequina sp. NBRC 110054]|uniref:DUF7402 domain-containing protein n=1 Tax=Demequina sp. NBRC 110054 TaxID=1570343 RepID=UPI0009FD0AEE|nr:family 16 glycosylhydrolase [Demequina sp. NBRC 110054]
MRSHLLIVAVVVCIAALAGFVAWKVWLDSEPVPSTVTASSTMQGFDADRLVARALATPAPEPATASSEVGTDVDAEDDPPLWRSNDETTGAWVEIEWESPVDVSRIRLDGAADADGGFTGALVTFDDGSAVLVTPDLEGNVTVDIPARTVSSARVRFEDGEEGVTSIALRGLLLDDSGEEVGSPDDPEVTGSAGGSDAGAVVDGDIAAGDLGEVWAGAGDEAWLEQAWDHPVALASVQLAGSGDGGEAVGGDLIFSDGSSIRVSAVSDEPGELTTVAFAPRTATWVRFEADEATARIGELRVYGPGITPPAWPVEDGYTVEPAAAEACTTASPAIGATQDSALALVCPEVGAIVGPMATVVVSAPAGREVSASAWVPDGDSGLVETVATAVAGDDGRAELTFDTSDLLEGPLAVRITTPHEEVPLYVQLYNSVGEGRSDESSAPDGMTLQYEETFDTPLSISRTGAGATYAASKPSADGATEFGAAVFLDPSLGEDLLATVDGMLRIRVEPLEGADPSGYERTYAGGLLSSARFDGSGVSAQYGYFEARILAPAGRGTWPAFWMLDTESTVTPGGTVGEVDAVELYGHNPYGSCHVLHNWPEGTGSTEDNPYCFHLNGHADWALAWHTYGVRVRPGGVDYTIDGVPITSQEDLELDSAPYFFMVNLALDGGWPVALDPTGGVVDMYVDWIRVYS